MKIQIILNEPYPHGMACTRRIHFYAKGLKECGNDVKVLIPRPMESFGKAKNTVTKGTFEGIDFQYAYHSTIRSRLFLRRRYHDFISFVNSFVLLINSKPNIILVTGSSFIYILLGKICASFLKAKYVRERSEVPFYEDEKISWIKELRIKAEYQFFDGLIVISSRLSEFFLDDMSLRIKILEVPILINSSNTELKNHIAVTNKPTLVYTGSLIDKKDGILIIIKAFYKMLKENLDLTLVLTGDINCSKDKDRILELIYNLGIKENVELTGYISQERLQKLTFSATALLLAKPDNRQNRYNMATKTGEYLLTGRPVIISSVDPVCQYLTHRENAFIVRPEEDEIFSEIKFIVDNPNEATSIGLNGKQMALRFFDYQIHALRINDFLKNL